MARSQDRYGHRAKQEGYPARSVYKLEEIDRRVRLLKRGGRILDLGASPGSWTLFAAERVGPQGFVLGLDLNPERTKLPPNAEFRECDVMNVDPLTLIDDGMFDAVISDMAPKTSGTRARDQFISYELYMRALEFARHTLKPGGNFIGKIFQGSEMPDARKATAELFETVRIMKPDASRAESYEIFLVGLSRRG